MKGAAESTAAESAEGMMLFQAALDHKIVTFFFCSDHWGLNL